MDRLAELHAPVIHPHAENDVNDGIVRNRGGLARAEGQGALAPVGGIADTDGIADAARLLEPVTVQHALPGGMHITGYGARFQAVHHRRHAFLDGGRGPAQLVGRGAEMDGARQPHIVALHAAAKLEGDGLAFGERRVCPQRVRRRRRLAGQDQRMNGGHVAAALRSAPDLGGHHFRHQVALPHAGARTVKGALHGGFGDARGAAHHLDFRLALDQTLPVHQQVGIDKFRPRKAGSQAVQRARREIVAVALIADPGRGEPMIRHPSGKMGHRVRVGTLHQLFGIGNDLRGGQIGGEIRRPRIHQPAHPERAVIEVHQHHLRGVEGPGVIAGKPVDIVRIADHQRIEAARRHFGAHPRQPVVIFGFQERRCHGITPVLFVPV